jgi:hypothetical protein
MHPDEGYTDALTQEHLEKLILYGEVMHSDFEKKEELAQVSGNMPLPKAVALLNYMRFARTVLGCAQRVAALIRERRYLSQECALGQGPQSEAEPIAADVTMEVNLRRRDDGGVEGSRRPPGAEPPRPMS